MRYQDFVVLEDIEDPYCVLLDDFTLDEIISISYVLQGFEVYFSPQVKPQENKYFRVVSSTVGEKKAETFFKLYPRGTVYFKKFRNCIGSRIKEMIVQEFNGYNNVELSVRYGLSVKYINEIIKSYEK